MRVLSAMFAALLILTVYGAAQPKAPEKLIFKTKMGNVTFNHAQHVVRAKDNCKTCHTALWPMSATAPLNFKAGMHKPAEANKTSCGFCHHPGGAAFETKGNCAKCHVKG